MGQVVPVPSGRLDKVSLYLEPDGVAPDDALVVVEAYAVDPSTYLPTGSPLATDAVPLLDIRIRGMYNFRVEASFPGLVAAIVLRTEGGTSDSNVAWRFVSVPASSSMEYMLISEDGGTSWSTDNARKFSYIAYSVIPDAVSSDTQSAEVQAGIPVAVTDTTEADFELGILEKTEIQGVGEGATVVIDFNDFAVTLVVDMSGSMTWNDHGGLRFDFLKGFIYQFEANLATLPDSEATYSLVKFRSRQVGRMDIAVQVGGVDIGSVFDGVRVVRDTVPIDPDPTIGPTQGTLVFEGFAEETLDGNLIPGTPYYYGLFSYDSAGNFSPGRLDEALTLDAPIFPLGAVGFEAAEDIVDEFCTMGIGEDVDVGNRRIVLFWADASNTDASRAYDGFYLTRRTDRFPESPWDGISLVQAGVSPLPPNYQYLGPAAHQVPAEMAILVDPSGEYEFSDFDPGLDAVNGLTYYYALFTFDSSGIICRKGNARMSSVLASGVDRVWRKEESAPYNDPSYYCFDETPPSPRYRP